MPYEKSEKYEYRGGDWVEHYIWVMEDLKRREVEGERTRLFFNDFWEWNGFYHKNDPKK